MPPRLRSGIFRSGSPPQLVAGRASACEHATQLSHRIIEGRSQHDMIAEILNQNRPCPPPPTDLTGEPDLTTFRDSRRFH